MEAVGLAASILGIVDIIGRSVLKLCDIREKFKKLEVTLARLIGELTATKAALNQLHETLSTSVGLELSDQLLVDLQTSLEACHLLITLIEDRIPTEDDNEKFAFVDKLHVLVADQEIKEALAQLSRTLLAINIVRDCVQRNRSSQLEYLEIPTNRQLLDKAAETASLDVLWDESSFASRHASIYQTESARSSRSSLSLRFPGLDEILLGQKQYRMTLQSVIGHARKTRGAIAPHTGSNIYDESFGQGPDQVINVCNACSDPIGPIEVAGDPVTIAYLLNMVSLSENASRRDATLSIRCALLDCCRAGHPHLILGAIDEMYELSAQERRAVTALLLSDLSASTALLCESLHLTRIYQSPERDAYRYLHASLTLLDILDDPNLLATLFSAIIDPSFIPSEFEQLVASRYEAQHPDDFNERTAVIRCFTQDIMLTQQPQSVHSSPSRPIIFVLDASSTSSELSPHFREQMLSLYIADFRKRIDEGPSPTTALVLAISNHAWKRTLIYSSPPAEYHPWIPAPTKKIDAAFRSTIRRQDTLRTAHVEFSDAQGILHAITSTFGTDHRLLPTGSAGRTSE